MVREYLLSRLGAKDIEDGLTVIESERRRRREMSYGYVHMIWIAAFADGSIVASVPLNTSEAIKSLIRGNVERKINVTDNAFISSLKALADGEARRLFGQKSCRCFSDLMFACDAATLAPAHPDVTPTRIIDNRFACRDDIHFPGHCLPDGIVYGVVETDKIVSVAYAHQTGEYQDIIADIGVETSKRFRRRGYARACVNAVARHVIQNGGESLYKCAPGNTASIHTALSAGYKPYGKSLIFSVHTVNDIRIIKIGRSRWKNNCS